jgi:hypothetical protein
MKLSEARNIKIGDKVVLKQFVGEYEITNIDKSRTTEKVICFWSYNRTFNHKDIEKIVK